MRLFRLLLVLSLVALTVIPIAVMAQQESVLLPIVAREAGPHLPTHTPTTTAMPSPTVTGTTTTTPTTTVTTTTTVTVTTTTTATVTATTATVTATTTVVAAPTATSTTEPAVNLIAYYAANSETGLYELKLLDPVSLTETFLIEVTHDDDGFAQWLLTWPAWSPEADRIAFASDLNLDQHFEDSDGRDWDVFVIDADGSNLTRLTTSRRHELHPSWSPDGSRIAFATNRHGLPEADNWDIYVIDPDGSNEMRLTLTSEAKERWPTWSPEVDGARYILYEVGDT